MSVNYKLQSEPRHILVYKEEDVGSGYAEAVPNAVGYMLNESEGTFVRLFCRQPGEWLDEEELRAVMA